MRLNLIYVKILETSSFGKVIYFQRCISEGDRDPTVSESSQMAKDAESNGKSNIRKNDFPLA